MEMRVLINDGFRPSTAVVRALGLHGIHVDVLTSTAHGPACHSRYCRRRYFGPPPTRDGFISRLIEILARESYDAFIPVGYEATLCCAQHQASLERLTKLGIADGESVRRAAEKRTAYEEAAVAGVPVPRTAYPATLAEATVFAQDFRYPIVIKPSRETNGHSVCYARSLSDFSSVYKAFCERSGFSAGALPMLQEFIPGHGCGFFALYQHGVCKRIFMHRRIREYPPSGGVSSCAESFFDPRLKEYGMRLLDRLRWHGLAMVEFRRDTRDSEFKLLEINPRFWGSLDLAVAAGVNFPYDLCQIIAGRELEYSDTYKRHLRFQWLLHEFRHGCRRPSSTWAVARDIFNPNVKSDFWLRDFAPNSHEAMEMVRGGVRRVAARFRPRYARSRPAAADCGGTNECGTV